MWFLFTSKGPKSVAAIDQWSLLLVVAGQSAIRTGAVESQADNSYSDQQIGRALESELCIDHCIILFPFVLIHPISFSPLGNCCHCLYNMYIKKPLYVNLEQNYIILG